jgi:hypothetical protein
VSLITGALAFGRAQAEARMTDAVLITRPSDAEPVLDEDTGLYAPATTTIYSGPGRLKSTSTVVGAVDAQGQNLAAQSLRLDLPVATSGGVQANDTVTITASVNDPSAVGLVLNVEGVFFQTDATARRFPVEVQT